MSRDEKSYKYQSCEIQTAWLLSKETHSSPHSSPPLLISAAFYSDLTVQAGLDFGLVSGQEVHAKSSGEHFKQRHRQLGKYSRWHRLCLLEPFDLAALFKCKRVLESKMKEINPLPVENAYISSLRLLRSANSGTLHVERNMSNGRSHGSRQHSPG